MPDGFETASDHVQGLILLPDVARLRVVVSERCTHWLFVESIRLLICSLLQLRLLSSIKGFVILLATTTTTRAMFDTMHQILLLRVIREVSHRGPCHWSSHEAWMSHVTLNSRVLTHFGCIDGQLCFSSSSWPPKISRVIVQRSFSMSLSVPLSLLPIVLFHVLEVLESFQV